MVRTSRPIKISHIDLCFPMRVTSLRGKQYILVTIVDFFYFTSLDFLREKSKPIIEFLKLCEELQAFKTYNGREFNQLYFHLFCAKYGISLNLFAPRAPKQNGVVERITVPSRTCLGQCFSKTVFLKHFGLKQSTLQITSPIDV